MRHGRQDTKRRKKWKAESNTKQTEGIFIQMTSTTEVTGSEIKNDTAPHRNPLAMCSVFRRPHLHVCRRPTSTNRTGATLRVWVTFPTAARLKGRTHEKSEAK
ncbi:hypothetical protein PINS_up008143 [Pythium insidiosum]|nr:hypothetical protein PINS_up008143 [Pythium insidiosum]